MKSAFTMQSDGHKTCFCVLYNLMSCWIYSSLFVISYRIQSLCNSLLSNSENAESVCLGHLSLVVLSLFVTGWFCTKSVYTYSVSSSFCFILWISTKSFKAICFFSGTLYGELVVLFALIRPIIHAKNNWK